MPTSTFAAPVCVTGASGFIASWVVKLLLERGATVRATVRDTGNASKVGFLKKVAEGLPGTLQLVKADLMDKGSFHEAVKGCEVVFHLASPFVIRTPKDPQRALVDPALQGTNNVLDAVDAAPSVRRVVLTSSVVATYGDLADIDGKVVDETFWNTTSSLEHQPYAYSKTVAEKAAWDRARAQSRWSLVTINPGFVLGPSLDPAGSGESVAFIRQLLDGTFATGVPQSAVTSVDVREVAQAHLEAGLRPEAEGRHLLVEGVHSFLDCARAAGAAAGPGYRVATGIVPRALLFVVGPLVAGLSWKWISRNVGAFSAKVDNTRSRERLGITYRPFETTIADQVRQQIADGVVRARAS